MTDTTLCLACNAGAHDECDGDTDKVLTGGEVLPCGCDDPSHLPETPKVDGYDLPELPDDVRQRIADTAPKKYNRDAELDRVAKTFKDPYERVMARRWVYLRAFEAANLEASAARSVHELLLARRTVLERAKGEKSAEVAKMKALAEDPDVFRSMLRWRIAEGEVSANRQALATLQAELDVMRTRSADNRAGARFDSSSPDIP